MLTITSTSERTHKEIAEQYTHLINNDNGIEVKTCYGTKVFKKENFLLVESTK